MNSNPKSAPGPERLAELIAGAALGLLLGLLVGLAESDVVSIVISALVALLAGFFGFEKKIASGTLTAGSKRLAAFAVAASLALPAAIWTRTHNLLGSPLQSEVAELEQLGFHRGSKDYLDLVRYMKFRLLPSGLAEGKQKNIGTSVLFADAASVCNDLAHAANAADVMQILGSSGAPYAGIAKQIENQPDDAKAFAKAYSQIFACALSSGSGR